MVSGSTGWLTGYSCGKKHGHPFPQCKELPTTKIHYVCLSYSFSDMLTLSILPYHARLRIDVALPLSLYILVCFHGPLLVLPEVPHSFLPRAVGLYLLVCN